MTIRRRGIGRRVTRGRGSVVALFCVVAVLTSVFVARLIERLGETPVRLDATTVSFRVSSGAAVSFNRDVRPILSDKCFLCHGPDAGSREAGLRLDERSGAIADRGENGGPAIIPGDPDSSILVGRIHAKNPRTVMPPPESGKELSEDEKAILEAWIAEGAVYEPHWAYTLLEPPLIPPSHAEEANPIDAFVRADLANIGRDLADPALLETQFRRVSLDLIGLPPTPAEMDDFLAAAAIDPDVAYADAVARLLERPAFGEHQARFWLDAARYADTHGLHLDNVREMWPYRDWVVDALNRNLPFDQFTIEQLAGDLLPKPTLDQRIASGFNRCHPTTSEGGAIDEEYIVKYTIDRVETTSTVWMGMTAGCAACHDHKYDPLSQRDFYRLFAFFNNTTEEAMDGNIEAPPPVVKVPTPDQERELKSLADRKASIEASLGTAADTLAPDIDEWSKSQHRIHAGRWELPRRINATSTGGATIDPQSDGSVVYRGENPTTDIQSMTFALSSPTPMSIHAIRIDLLLDEEEAAEGDERGPGRNPDNANFFLTEIEVQTASSRGAIPTSRDDAWTTLEVSSAWASHEQDGFPLAHALDGVQDNPNQGWASRGGDHPAARIAVVGLAEPLHVKRGDLLRVRLHANSIYSGHGVKRSRIFVSTEPGDLPVQLSGWETTDAVQMESFESAMDAPVTSIPFGSGVWSPADYTDGTAHELEAPERSVTWLRRTIVAKGPRQLVLGIGSDDGLEVFFNGESVHRNATRRSVTPDDDEVTIDIPAGSHDIMLRIANDGGQAGFAFRVKEERRGNIPELLAGILIRPENEWTDGERDRLRDWYLRNEWEEGRERVAAVDAIDAEVAKLNEEIPTTLVSMERTERRPAYILDRGAYDAPTEEVKPGTPDFLPSMPTALSRDRLGFARWLVDPTHPLTARVTVNRLWQQYFGRGLVSTPEDFGLQGASPTHPALLDWLAWQFVRSGWDVKEMHQLIVTSKTYRQQFAFDEFAAIDPENERLSRGNRHRLDAEVIRDQALFLAGLLEQTVGGPPVRPYQPDGVWKALAYSTSNTGNYERGDATHLYRRSLYTFWKRTAPPPNMMAFDAPSREICSVGRERTNSPIAALVLMNDEQFVEAARAFGLRMRARDADLDASLGWGFRAATGRHADDEELQMLRDYFQSERAVYTDDDQAARALATVGEFMAPPDIAPADVAAWTMVGSLILNLDETINRP